MALTYSLKDELGKPAPDFSLQGVMGVAGAQEKRYSLESFKDARALVVIFMCNHCPYVVAVQERINNLAKLFAPQGVALVGINSNDSLRYPDDNFQAMQVRAREQSYTFPYLLDETQNVAKAYGAVCTPDPYVFENVAGRFLLRYHGRIDDNWKEPHKVSRQDLALALEAILTGGKISLDSAPSMGCSIKWK